MARHRSPRGRGTYPAPPQTARRRHAAGRGARQSVLIHAGGVAYADGADGAVSIDSADGIDSAFGVDSAVPIDGPAAPRARQPGIVRIPAPRAPEPEPLVAPEPVLDAPPAPVPRRSAARRFGTVAAVAAASGAISLVAANIPGDTLSGGSEAAPALALDASVHDQPQPQAPAPAAAADGELAAAALVGPQPLVATAGDLVAAVHEAQAKVAAAERQRIASEQQAAAAAKTRARQCGLDERGLGPVKPYVRVAAQLLGCRFGEPTMYGVAGRAGTSDHPTGKAVDFMVDRRTGDALAGCALRNQDALGISYVIWRQRINFGNGWEAMEDRGNATANHFDHVHISFGNGASGDALEGCG